MASGVTTIITAIAKIANAGVFFNGLANASNALYFLCLCTSTCWCSKGSQKKRHFGDKKQVSSFIDTDGVALLLHCRMNRDHCGTAHRKACYRGVSKVRNGVRFS